MIILDANICLAYLYGTPAGVVAHSTRRFDNIPDLKLDDWLS